MADRRQLARDLVTLARPRLALLGLLMVGLAYAVAGPAIAAPGGWPLVILACGLALGGASALNQALERVPDALMRRTADRPVAAGRISVRAAAAYGLLLSAAGIGLLAAAGHGLAASLTVLGWAIYLFVYTPMKRRSSLNSVVGAVPGAMPVLMGWAAARGRLDAEAWALFGILFLWQLPHFLAIAWMYRADYARAGFRMLPVEAPDGASTARQVVGYCLALVPVSLLPTLFDMAGPAYFVAALALGAAYLAYGLRLGYARTGLAARRLVKASVIYLPLLFILLVLDGGLS